MKLSEKYLRINLLVMLGIFLLSSIAFYWLVKFVLIRELDADLDGVAARFKEYVAQHGSFPQPDLLDEVHLRYSKQTDATGRGQAAVTEGVQAATTERGEAAVKESVYSSVMLYSNREKKMHNFRQLVFNMPLNGVMYTVAVAKPLEGLHHVYRALLMASMCTVLVIIITIILINRLVLSRLWRPFYETIHAIRNFKLGGTTSILFPATQIEEFGFMNMSLKEATEKAEKDYLLLKEFTENASHELQTPLSIIRAKLDLLIQDDGLSQKQSEITRSAYGAVKKLSRLNQSMLLLAKIENRQFKDVEEIQLNERLEEKLEQFQELWQSREISVESRIEEATIKANPELIDVLLNNLFSNASNHNVPRGSIDVVLRRNQLVISNAGLPVPLDASRLYHRFYKAAQYSSGNGLGLSIVKQICDVSSITPGYSFVKDKHVFTMDW
jgi:signal transduction histidine kinase